MRAKLERDKKDAAFHRAGIAWKNKDKVQYKKGKADIVRGISRTTSDNYVQAKHALGTARNQLAALKREEALIVSHREYGGRSGESVSNRFSRGKLAALQARQATIESSVDTTFGRNMAGKNQKVKQFAARAYAKNLEAVGAKPVYGLPVQQIGKGSKAGQYLQMGLSVASLALAASDIRLKENIEQVGKSKSGYKIYEWNYKSDKNTRYRGVIAQDVVKINPMAVGIRDNYLTVNYNKLDVDMEIVS